MQKRFLWLIVGLIFIITLVLGEIILSQDLFLGNFRLKNFAFFREKSQAKNRSLDVLVYGDDGYDDLTVKNIRRVLNLTDSLFYKKVGIHLVFRDVRFESLGRIRSTGIGYRGNDSDTLAIWGKNILEKEKNPPEIMLIFSKMDPSWRFGGFASTSAVVDTQSPYCNEFEIREIGQRGAGIVVVDWNHFYASCGYNHVYPEPLLISENPTSGECRGDSSDTCVLRRDGKYYQCQSTLYDLSSNLDYFRASTIIHEIVHTLDEEEFGHYGSQCGVPDENLVGEENFHRAAEENFNMCPKTFEQIPLRLKGCRGSGN